MEMIDAGLKDFINNADYDYGLELAGNQNNNGFARALMEQLVSYKSWAGQLHGTRKAKICVGGIVTRILEACSVRVRSKPIPPQWLDTAYLVQHRVLRKATRRGTWMYQFRQPGATIDSTILLPNVEVTALGYNGNISFLPPATLITQPRTRLSQPASEPEPTEIQGEEPECYYFDDYVDPKMTKELKVAHEHIGKVQKANKWNTKAIRFILNKLSLSFGSNTRERDPIPPEVRAPTPPPLRRSTSSSRHTNRRSTSEQPRRASSHVHRPMPQPEFMQQETTPPFQSFDLNSPITLEQQGEPSGALYSYTAERTPELNLEQSFEPPRRRRSTSRLRRHRSQSVEPQFTEPAAQPQHFTPHSAFNFLDPMGSTLYQHSTRPEQQSYDDDSMEVDPAGWSIFR